MDNFQNLSRPQKLIYNMEKFSGGSIATICGSVMISGKADIENIIQNVNKLYFLNDALRIHIIECDGVAKQYVREYIAQNIKVLHFENDKTFTAYAQNIAKEKMGINGELCKIEVVIVGEKYGLLVKLHHIISDAWSFALLASQFVTLMEGGIPKAELYINYLNTEKEYLSSGKYQKDKEYWLEKFSMCDEPVFIAPKSQLSVASYRKTFVLDSEFTKMISKYCESVNTNASIYTMLMTVISIYVNRITNNSEKFYIGTTVLNRATKSEKNTVGMFINTIPVLIELDNNNNFQENMQLVTNSIFSAFRHQKYNYGDILKDIRQEYGFDEKLYDVVVSYQNAKISGNVNGIVSQWYHCGMQNESLQIHIDDRDNEGILKINYDYQTDKFSSEDIKKMHTHIINILKEVIEDSNKKIFEIQMLSQEEKRTLLYDFNDTKIKYPDDKCAHLLFEEKAFKSPNNMAVIASDRTLTYGELNSEANKIAHNLIKRGIKQNDIVAFMLPRNSYLLSVILGILKSGAAYMPIDIEYPQDRVEFMLEDSDAKLCITEELLEELLCDSSVDNLQIISKSTDKYCVIYTSGSTGRPKGCILLHKGVVNFSINSNVIKYFEKIGKEPVGISVNNVTFDYFIAENIVLLLNGKTTVLCTKEESIIPEKFWGLCKKHNVNLIQTTPTRYKILWDDKYVSDNIELIVSSGEPLLEELYNKIKRTTKAEIFNPLGPSETTVWVPNGEGISKTNIHIGRPIANTQVYIVDKHENLVPIGKVGELCIAGDCVGAGYLNRPQLTAEKFVDNPFGMGKMYKTGDLAYWQDDGNIAYVGRNDFQVKIRGLRIELGEIENAICMNDNILQAVVVVRKDGTGRQLICAFYTEKSHVEIETLKENIREHLPKYMMPHIFKCLEKMPLTASGKINRKVLPIIDLNDLYKRTEYIKPSTSIEIKLTEIMEEVLEYSPIGLKDDFFDCGGDSLKAIEFVSKAYSEGIYIDLQAVFDNPTVEELSTHILEGNVQKNIYLKDDFINLHQQISNNKISKSYGAHRSEIGNILLSGATGYLGIHVLSEYLDTESGKAYCLIRGENIKESCKRFQSLLNFYFGNKYDYLLGNRIIIICGDIEKDKLNLDNVLYNTMEKDVQTVIHAAASVKHYGSYEYFEKINVNGTLNMIEFAKRSKAKLIHISTISVSGDGFETEDINMEEKLFDESCLYIGQNLENVYARSKFEAERAVVGAISDGLEANICRMGNLTNRYKDGQFQKNHESNAFFKRMKAILELGEVPDYLLDYEVEYTPVDSAAKAIMTIAKQFNKQYNIFHLYNQKTISLKELLELLSEYGINVHIVNEDVFAKTLQMIAKDPDKEYIFETLINHMNKDEHINYSGGICVRNDFTEDYLRKLGFEWQNIDLDYLAKWVGYFQKAGYLKA